MPIVHIKQDVFLQDGPCEPETALGELTPHQIMAVLKKALDVTTYRKLVELLADEAGFPITFQKALKLVYSHRAPPEVMPQVHGEH